MNIPACHFSCRVVNEKKQWAAGWEIGQGGDIGLLAFCRIRSCEPPQSVLESSCPVNFWRPRTDRRELCRRTFPYPTTQMKLVRVPERTSLAPLEHPYPRRLGFRGRQTMWRAPSDSKYLYFQTRRDSRVPAMYTMFRRHSVGTPSFRSRRIVGVEAL